MQIGYDKLRISRGLSRSPLDFEITTVAQYNQEMNSVRNEIQTWVFFILFVGGFIYHMLRLFCLFCSSSLLLLVPREGYAL